MTGTTDDRIKQASLREEWSVSSVERLARAMGRPAAGPAATPRAAAGLPGAAVAAATPPGPSAAPATMPDPARRARLIQALGRLAADVTATPAERSLAEQRLAEVRAWTPGYRAAC